MRDQKQYVRDIQTCLALLSANPNDLVRRAQLELTELLQERAAMIEALESVGRWARRMRHSEEQTIVQSALAQVRAERAAT